MSFIKEFKEFALKGNLVDIAVAFVMGGAFGKVVSTFTEKLIAPLIGLLTGGTNFYDKKLVLKSAVSEVKDPEGNIVVPHGDEVALEWGAFVTVIIDFLIVCFSCKFNNFNCIIYNLLIIRRISSKFIKN